MSVVAPGARIGFVGLGNLGQPIAPALIRAGWSVAVLDTAAAKAEPRVAEGARAAAGPGELAGCAVVALAVPDDAAAETVLCGSGLLGSLDADAVVLVHSTILPESGRWLAATAAERGIGLIDAPVPACVMTTTPESSGSHRSQPGSTAKTCLKTWWGSHRPFASWSFL